MTQVRETVVSELGGVPHATALPTRAAARDRWIRRCVLTGTLLTLAAITLAGLPYYVLGPGARLRSPLHPWFKPSGYVGQSAGIIAFLLFAFLWLYPLRKKWRRLAFTGSIGRWLDVHVVAGLAVPLLGAIHAAWRFDGLIGLGYVSMLLVSLSGIVGRYIYVHIPRSRDGLALTLDDVVAERRDLLLRIAAITRAAPSEIEALLAVAPGDAPTGRLRTLAAMLGADLGRRRAARSLARLWAPGTGRTRPDRDTVTAVVRLARREIALRQQVRMLEATRRLFRFWHVAHRPIALTALGAVLVHVGVVISVGATWLW